ncbi:MAG: hypothetical protein AAF829_06620 [Pseudomonadota bacterium]
MSGHASFSGAHGAALLREAGGDVNTLIGLIEAVRENNPFIVTVKPKHIREAKAKSAPAASLEE